MKEIYKKRRKDKLPSGLIATTGKWQEGRGNQRMP
jgi:hypothetical protein